MTESAPERTWNSSSFDSIVRNMSSELDCDDDRYAIIENPKQQRLIFTSPRLSVRDEDIFQKDDSLYSLERRWDSISEQAGDHGQSGRVISIHRRFGPKSFHMGMMKHVSLRVRSLSLCIDHKHDNLTEWIDVISGKLVNLENLTILDAQDDDMVISKRMQRLYILNAMPNLNSIDEIPISREEREIVHRHDRINEEQCIEEADGEERETVLIDSFEESIHGEGELPRLTATDSNGSNEDIQLSTNNSTETVDLVKPNDCFLQNVTMKADSPASPHHEWSASCGVLAFRALPFCGANANTIPDEDCLDRPAQQKGALQEEKEIIFPTCPPVRRQSSIRSQKSVVEPGLHGAGMKSPVQFFPVEAVQIEAKAVQRFPVGEIEAPAYATTPLERRGRWNMSQPLPLLNRYQTTQQLHPRRNGNLIDPFRGQQTRTRITRASKENARRSSVLDGLCDGDEEESFL
eukprot:scaffold20791_cov137-Cylindrotheca_fusiformis.AAC.6